MKRVFPRCSAATKDGSQCGRRVKDGSQPPICHVHEAQLAGKTQPHHFTAAPFDAQAKLEKIARNDGHPQQLAAIKLLREANGTPQGGSDRDSQNARLVAAMTADEKEEIKIHLAAIRVIKQRIYERDNSLRPEWEAPAPLTSEEPEPTGPVIGDAPVVLDNAPPSAASIAAFVKGARTADESASSRPALAERDLPSLGCVKVAGRWTHVRGDEYLNGLLDGTIDLEEARSEHAESVAQGVRFDAALRKGN